MDRWQGSGRRVIGGPSALFDADRRDGLPAELRPALAGGGGIRGRAFCRRLGPPVGLTPLGFRPWRQSGGPELAFERWRKSDISDLRHGCSRDRKTFDPQSCDPAVLASAKTSKIRLAPGAFAQYRSDLGFCVLAIPIYRT